MTQVYEYVEDIAAALTEARRVLRAAGLQPRKSAIIPILNVGTDRDTFSTRMSRLVAAYVPGRGGVSQADLTAWEQDLAGLGDDYFFSLNRYLSLAHRSSREFGGRALPHTARLFVVRGWLAGQCRVVLGGFALCGWPP